MTREREGRERLTCPFCGWIDYRQLKVGAGIVLVREGKLLLVQRSPHGSGFPGAWGLPAGYCEADEDPRHAAAREAAEETALEVEAGRLAGAFYFDDDPRGNGLLIVYEGVVAGGWAAGWEPTSSYARSPEIAACRFFAAEELPQPLCGGGHDRAIDAWRQRALDRWRPGLPLRFCPHCTAPLAEQVAFDRLRLACSACGFVHFRELKVGVSLLLEKQGRLLLVQRGIEPEFGKWSLPSGFVEWDETPEEAARRECLEETGLAVDRLELLEVHHYSDDPRGPGINLVYRARVDARPPQAGDDACEARFLAPADLPPPDQVAFHGHRALLARWREAAETASAQPELAGTEGAAAGPL